MIDNPILDNDFDRDELIFTSAGLMFLDEAAKWAKILAIIGFVFLGLAVLMVISIGSLFGAMGSEFGELSELYTASMSGGIIVFYLLILSIYFFPTLYFYRFAVKTRRAIAMVDSHGLTDGLENLKKTFKFIGILMIIFVSLYGFLFLIMGGGLLMM